MILVNDDDIDDDVQQIDYLLIGILFRYNIM